MKMVQIQEKGHNGEQHLKDARGEQSKYHGRKERHEGKFGSSLI